MAMFIGTERSNYVRFRPEALALVGAYCDLFAISLIEGGEGSHTLLPSDMSDDGCFGCRGYVEKGSVLCEALEGLTFDDERDDCEVDFDPALIAKWMMPGEVLVIQRSGAEKLRFVGGSADAFNHLGEYVGLNLDDIYAKAAAAFGVQEGSICHASY